MRGWWETKREGVPFKLVCEVARTGGWVETADEENARHRVGREGQCGKKGLVWLCLFCGVLTDSLQLLVTRLSMSATIEA